MKIIYSATANLQRLDCDKVKVECRKLNERKIGKMLSLYLEVTHSFKLCQERNHFSIVGVVYGSLEVSVTQVHRQHTLRIS